MSFWTADTDERARALWLRGIPARDVANAIGAASASAVFGRMWRLGVVRSHVAGWGSSPGRYRSAPEIRAPMPAPTTVPCDPRPWLSREAGQCAYPVDGEGFAVRSCCNPTGGGSYCQAHRRAVIADPPEDSRAPRMSAAARTA